MFRSARRNSVQAGGAAIVALLVLASGGAGAAPGEPDDDAARVLSSGRQVAAKGTPRSELGVDPYRGLVADPSSVDYAAWKRILNAKSAKRHADDVKIPTSPDAARAVAAQEDAVFYQEQEPAGTRGSNDFISNAEHIAGVGTGAGDSARAFVLGRINSQPHPSSMPTLDPKAEDNGSIPLSHRTGVRRLQRAARIFGTVGDGPHGAAPAGDESGDFDAFKVTLLRGQQLIGKGVATTDVFDPYAGLYDATGTLVAFNDDSNFSLNSRISYVAPAAGDYYFFLGGYRQEDALPSDPFDSGSGSGMGSVGTYKVVLSTAFPDIDYYQLDAEAGDVLGLSAADGATVVGIHEGSGELVHGSNQDISFLYAPNSPLPGGGNAVAAHVVRETGPIYFAIEDGNGIYTADVSMHRPGPEYRETDQRQTLFLDFDGQRVNTAIWGGPGVRTLSPLSAFLARWGLSAGREDPLIDQIVHTTKENVRNDLRAINPDLRLRVLNSRDHPDVWGDPDVTRVIVGGTIDESGIPTIGIAQYIDPGNYGTEDSAVVLLDLLSDPGGEDYSLNTYITGSSAEVRFIGTAIGNVVAHEAGHMIGNYHVDQFNDLASLMDQGGNFPVLYGVGPDNIGGTADDPDVDFNKDVYNPNEGFFGLEQTDVRAAWAHAPGRGLAPFPA